MYITRNTHISSIPEYIQERYKNKIEIIKQTTEYLNMTFEMLDPSVEEKMEVINEDFRWRISYVFEKDIYFIDEFKNDIIDADGNIRVYDEDLFLTVKYHATKFMAVYDEAIATAQMLIETIKNGNYSDGVKKLADAYMHESRVSFTIKEPYITAHFGYALYHPPLLFKFHAIIGKDTQVFDCEINESEVLINPDGTFQYNAIVYAEENYDVLKEITIRFYDVEVEEVNICC